jgi:hypothetical protein
MWRFLFLFAAIAIVASLISRWWFGIRILQSFGKRPCRCDLAKWLPAPGDPALIHRAEATASEFGRDLRLKALAEWRERDPKAAKSRESARRFGLAVPPLSGIVALLAVFVAKLIVFGGIAIFVGATAIAALIGVLSIAAELQAISLSARNVKSRKTFPQRDDEDAVIRAAFAHAWMETLPPILSKFQK